MIPLAPNAVDDMFYTLWIGGNELAVLHIEGAIVDNEVEFIGFGAAVFTQGGYRQALWLNVILPATNVNAISTMSLS